MTNRHALIFLGPVALVMALGFFVPLGQIFFTSVDGPKLTLRPFAELIDSRLFWLVLQNTFAISVESMLASLLLAYPIAYHLSRVTPRRRAAYMVLVLLPFWTSILVKSFAFIGDSRRPWDRQQHPARAVRRRRRWCRCCSIGPAWSSAPCTGCCRSWCSRSWSTCWRRAAICTTRRA